LTAGLSARKLLENKQLTKYNMKNGDKTVWLIYDVFDDEPMITDNRDVAVDAKLELKREVFEQRIVSTLSEDGTEIRMTITEPFLRGR
jgi:hypothetical protein